MCKVGSSRWSDAASDFFDWDQTLEQTGVGCRIQIRIKLTQIETITQRHNAHGSKSRSGLVAFTLFSRTDRRKRCRLQPTWDFRRHSKGHEVLRVFSRIIWWAQKRAVMIRRRAHAEQPALIYACVEVLQDSETGTNHTLEALAKRIHECFLQNVRYLSWTSFYKAGGSETLRGTRAYPVHVNIHWIPFKTSAVSTGISW